MKETASYDSLKPTLRDEQLYQLLLKQDVLSQNVSANQLFFDSGLVNAATAVQTVKQIADD